MATYSGILKKWNQVGTVWDVLYPKTIADNIISGSLHLDRIPVLTEAKIPSLDASKIGSGTIDVARLPAVALTNVVVYTTLAAFVTAYQANHNLVQSGDVVVLTTDKQTYIHNGGTAWTSADLTLLQTPTDVVTSVAGKVGAVTLVKGDVGLENVDNTADNVKNVLSATKLTTPRTIGGVSFDGSANINLPGVNTTGNQNTTGSAAKLTTPRTIAGVSFDGSANIAIPFANLSSKPTTLDGYGITNAFIASGKLGKDLANHMNFTGQVIVVYSDDQQVFEFNTAGGSHDAKNRKLVNVSAPQDVGDAVNKGYADNLQMRLVDDVATIVSPVDGLMAFEY